MRVTLWVDGTGRTGQAVRPGGRQSPPNMVAARWQRTARQSIEYSYRYLPTFPTLHGAPQHQSPSFSCIGTSEAFVGGVFTSATEKSDGNFPAISDAVLACDVNDEATSL